MNSRWLTAALVVLALGGAGCGMFGPSAPDDSLDPEARIVAYLDENVRPGRLVLVTDLYNNVFTEPEEREALQHLYDSAVEIPAYVAQVYTDTGAVPSLEEISLHFAFSVPGTARVLLRVLESDPRVPDFLQRDPATGEILSVNVPAVRADQRFGRSLRN